MIPVDTLARFGRNLATGAARRRTIGEIADVCAACAVVSAMLSLDTDRIVQRQHDQADLFLRWADE